MSWPGPIEPSRSPSSTSACPPSPRSCARTRRGWSATTPTCATSSSRSRTPGSGCSRSASASAARRRRCASPSTWPKTRTFPLSRAEAVERVRPLLADPPRTPRVPAAASCCRSSQACRHRRAWPAVPSSRTLRRPCGSRRPARRRSSFEPRRRPTTSTGWPVAAGILTSRGGLASHAAVVARGWGIPAVVGATGDRGRRRPGRRRRPAPASGDVITIDGSTGEVFEGTIPATTEVVPEAGRCWLGREEPGSRSATRRRPTTSQAPTQRRPIARSRSARAPRPTTAPSRSRSKASRRPRGSPTPRWPRRTSPAVLDQLALDGLVATVAGAYRLTDAGTEPCRRAARRRT